MKVGVSATSKSRGIMSATVPPAVAQGVSPRRRPWSAECEMVRKDYAARHESCVCRRLHRAMDATTKPLTDDRNLDLDNELETWDWARAAGVSADDLRQALRASLSSPELRRAA